MSKLKIRLIALGLLVAGLFFWVVTTQGPLAPVKVTLDQATVGTLENAVFGVGTVEARRSYNLAPTLTSRVARVLVDQGDHVKAGQLLAEMDAVDLNDRVTSSEQAVERAQYAIRVAEAQQAEAQSRAQTANATHARFANLRTGGFVSQEMLDVKLHEKNAAQSALSAATAALASARLDETRIRADAAGVGKLRAQTRLLSPVNGIVTARLAEPGVTLVAGQSLLQVIDPTSLWVKTRIDQRQAGQVRAGLAADIMLRSQPQTSLPGSVRRVEQISDAVTEERMADVTFANADEAAVVGELAEVTIRLPALPSALSVPSAAVKRQGQQEGVWVQREGRAQFVEVKAGVSTLSGRTQILSGLAENDEVIVYSQQALQAGMKVKVVPALVKAQP